MLCLQPWYRSYGSPCYSNIWYYATQWWGHEIFYGVYTLDVMTIWMSPSRRTIPPGLPPVKSKITTVSKTNIDYTCSNKLQIHEGILITNMNVLVNKMAKFTYSQPFLFQYDSDWCIMAYLILIIKALWFSIKISNGQKADEGTNTTVSV